VLGNRPEAADRTQTALTYKQLNIITKEMKISRIVDHTAGVTHTSRRPRRGELVGAIRDEQSSQDVGPGQHELLSHALSPANLPKRHPPTTHPHHTQTHIRPSGCPFEIRESSRET